MASTKTLENSGVRLAGVTIKRVTGFNAKFVFDNKIGPGSLITLTRSGDVIPHIVKVLSPSSSKKPQMPEVPWEWNKNRVEAVLIDKESDPTVAKKRVTYFFSKLDVEGLRIGTINKFFDAGLDTIIKIVKADKEDFLAVDGIQERTAQKLRTNIDQALKRMTLPALMDASGFFGALGEKRLTLITDKHADILLHSTKGMRSDLLQIRGFKDTLAAQFIQGLPGFKAFYKQLGIKAQAPVKIRVTNGALSGQTVVFTGFRDSNMESAVKAAGGQIGTAVNSKTTILCVKDLTSGSSKVVKAKQLGIKVVSAYEFLAELKKM